MSTPAKPKPRFFVDGWGKDWFVVSRNNKTVARCPSKKWATLITKLLIADAFREDMKVLARKTAKRAMAEADRRGD
jgi:hypothetical protein